MTRKRMQTQGRRGPETQAVADELFAACVELQAARLAVAEAQVARAVSDAAGLTDLATFHVHMAQIARAACAVDRIAAAAMRFTGVEP